MQLGWQASSAQSVLLAAAVVALLVAPPPPIVVGTATFPDLVAETENKRSLKRQKLQVPPATSGDLANAKVR